MVKKHNNKGKRANFKKILAGGVVLTTFLVPQAVYASDSSKKEKAPVSIILGARKELGGNKLYGGELGIGIGRFALVGNMGSGSDINLQDSEKNVFGDVYFQGIENLEKRKSLGLSLEYHPRISEKVSGVIGAGGGLEKRTRNIEENLVRRTDSEETLLASNINSIPEKGFGWNVYTGLIFDLTKNISLNPNIGYKIGLKEKGMFANLRLIFSFREGK
jgi:opacity protein-like surface antigen